MRARQYRYALHAETLAVDRGVADLMFETVPFDDGHPIIGQLRARISLNWAARRGGKKDEYGRRLFGQQCPFLLFGHDNGGWSSVLLTETRRRQAKLPQA